MSTRELTIFEFGFGTGLNVLLSMLYANDRKIFYHAMELHPLAWSEVEPLGYSKFLNLSDDEEIRFSMIHSAEWNHEVKIKKGFYLKKIHGSILNTILDEKYDLIYYDAFAPAVQPELWGEQVFLKLYDSLKPGGRLVTYCAKGEVRRIMISAGFKVERLPGPPGKREILRATKNC
jgi:tRNA U34 5-methylaminomethyl-2-thiouridine-forming methyltransferase MnmC